MELNSSDLFNGKHSVEQAIQQLRTQLLDLSGRNRLISYRHPKGRSIQVIDDPNITSVFNRLLDHKSLILRAVPNPPADLFTGKRPEAKAYAKELGMDISEEFPAPLATQSHHQRQLTKLQTLYYPADLEKLCRKLRSEANTVIEETGSNMLYVIFGFLEYYDREDSEKPILAPLLSVPITLERGEIDILTRTYQYAINYSGEDVQDNESLREKLSREFLLHLPLFDEETEPEAYLTAIDQAVKGHKRWRVRNQLTVGFLSFGKLAIWADLDPRKWDGFDQNKLLNELFAGNSQNQDIQVGEDYDIDQQPDAQALSLVYDADSAQHSALIDVLAGKNRVINGPPGTGKSQTITNIIAAALKKGLKVLFVSEKLAALEVVRHRLNQADLGHFCLELHSHKTHKKKLLEDLQKRLDQKFTIPQQIEDKLTALNRQKHELNTYAQLIASTIGNELGLSAHEVFWKADYFRGKLGEHITLSSALIIPQASQWTLDDIEIRRSKLSGLARLLDSVGPYGPASPWWGFQPHPLIPGDEETIRQVVDRALQQATSLEQVVVDFTDKVDLEDEPSLAQLLQFNEWIGALPPTPAQLMGGLLANVFSPQAQSPESGLEPLRGAMKDIRESNRLYALSQQFLKSTAERKYDEVEPLMLNSSTLLTTHTPDKTVNQLNVLIQEANAGLVQFDEIIAGASYKYGSISEASLSQLDTLLVALSQKWGLKIHQQQNQTTQQGVNQLVEEVNTLEQSHLRINRILDRYAIFSDDRFRTFQTFSQQEGFEGLQIGVTIDEGMIKSLQAALTILPTPLQRLTWSELAHRSQALLILKRQIEGALTTLKDHARQLGFPIEESAVSIANLVTVAELSIEAPDTILDLRHASFAHPRMGEMLRLAQEKKQSIKSQQEKLQSELYLDALPSRDELKAALLIFRQTGDSVFNFLNREWRTAKKQLDTLNRKKFDRKAQAYQDQISSILRWQEDIDLFTNNQEFKAIFGLLFRGIETDFISIGQLYEWFLSSQIRIHRQADLIKHIDLANTEGELIRQYAFRAPNIIATAAQLTQSIQEANHLLETELEDKALRNSRSLVEKIDQVSNELGQQIERLKLYVALDLSPARSLAVLSAALACKNAANDFEILTKTVYKIHQHVEPLLPGIIMVPGEYIGSYIEQLKEIVQLIQQVEVLILPFSTPEATLEDIQKLMRAECRVKACLGQFTFVPSQTEATSWADFSSLLHRRLSIIEGFITELVIVAISGEETVRQTVDGLRAQHESERLIKNIASNKPLMGWFGNHFKGRQTDDISVEATLNWGESILKNSLIRWPEMWDLLTNPAAATNVAWLKQVLSQLVALAHTVEESMSQLGRFGSFSWETWSQRTGGTASPVSASRLRQRLQRTIQANEQVLVWSQYYAARRDCESCALLPFVTALEEHGTPKVPIESLFLYAVYWSMAKNIYTNFPVFREFIGVKHASLREEFAALDRDIIRETGKTFAHQINKSRKVPDGVNHSSPRLKTQMWLLYHELGKQKRHLPIRQLIKRAGKALQGLKPCFMMGPLSVAQYLEPGEVEFDLIVMDEASQLRPEEALGAIARGKQLVVVGDPKQLPPTSFFDRIMQGDEDDDADSATVFEGSESILDICQQLFHPVRTLRWHYRSQHESLIAFSNHHFYDGKLIVFPSPFDRNSQLGVRYRYVQNGVYMDRRNVIEATRVADAVLEHMLQFPTESLGVVTLNQTQRELVEDLLEKKLRDIEAATAYKDYWGQEGLPFFVKNLENVQGDERDVIFISTTFGKAPNTDKVRQNFGPISQKDGWRRLNVLFTRARRKLHLFTSLQPEDILSDEKTPRGTQALRDYLIYAKQGILTSVNPTGREADSDFELSVGNLLQTRGYEVVPQLGVAGFYIDLAVRNPDRPGEFLAAIECDGATYHSSKSARDRDRIRQAILESLGWQDRIWRIWSTDWFYNPRRETERLLTFLEERRVFSRLQPMLPMEEFEFAEDLKYNSENFVQEGILEPIDSTLSTIREELYVEIGDQVTYCFADKPREQRTIQIIEGNSEPARDRFNYQSPLGQALLDCQINETKQLENNGVIRSLRVLKISRLP